MPFLTVEAALFPEMHAEAQGPPIHGVQYIGNKRKLLQWIQGHIPEGTKRVADAFSGGGSVSYMLKHAGLQVASNDSLHWSYHIARATVVNQNATVTEDEIKALCQPNANAGSFVRTHYKGLFWKEGVHQVIDEIRENIDRLSGFKRDIALAALGGTMLSARGWFPQFTTSKVADGGYTPEMFKARLALVIRRLNEMVFEGPTCEAHNLDVREFLPKVKADLAYFDPPYVTEFSAANYSVNYHVIEAVMVKGVGRNPSPTSKNKVEKSQTDLTRTNVDGFFEQVFKAAGHIRNWLLSYRDKSFPREDALKKFFTDSGREVSLVAKDHKYTLAGTRRDADPSNAKEYLFVGTKRAVVQKQEAAQEAKVKVPHLNLASKDVVLDVFWEKHAPAIVQALGWHGLATTCAIVDVNYPAEEFEGAFPKAFDAYHHPVMALGGEGELLVVRDALQAAAASLSDQSQATLLTKGDAARALAKIRQLQTWAEAVSEPPPDSDASVPRGHAEVRAFLGDNLVVMTSCARFATLAATAMVSIAEEQRQDKDHEIKFILCHAGTNRNGDHFTVDELKKAAKSAVGVKINLKHGQKAQDIVGKIETAVYEDVDGGRVVCVGKLFTSSDELAAKARKLIQEDIITKVSMECSYQEGECSICGHRHRSFKERCEHLQESKGGTIGGKRVYEIMHEIVFTGAGLLESMEPADPGADITAMAKEENGRMFASACASASDQQESCPVTREQVPVRHAVLEELWEDQDVFGTVLTGLLQKLATGESSLDEFCRRTRAIANDCADRVIQIGKTLSKKEAGSMDQNKALNEMSHEELLQHAERLATENKDLRCKVTAAEQEKAADEAKKAAEKLVALMEKKGRSFGSDEARQAEVEKLAALTDDARKAVEETWSGLPDRAASEDANAEPGKEDEPEGTATAQASAKGSLRSNASTQPQSTSTPEPASYKDKLHTALKAAAEARS